jgi:hypothetical protein
VILNAGRSGDLLSQTICQKSFEDGSMGLVNLLNVKRTILKDAYLGGQRIVF